MRIDAHQHYWEISKGYYDWINENDDVLYKDYQPSDLNPLLVNHKMDQSVTVQASPLLEDTQYLLKLSEINKSIAGVVGWVDLTSSTYQDDLEKLKQHPKFVGIRVMIQDMADAEILFNKTYLNAFSYLEDNQIPVDLLIKEHQLPVIVQLLKQVPELKAVIDHLGKPNIVDGDPGFWKRYMKEVATFANVYCKVSGLVTEAKKDWEQEDFVPYIQHTVQTFGISRVMFGSDWPVCLLAASYDDVITIVEEALSTQLTGKEFDQLFGGNAIRFYSLENV